MAPDAGIVARCRHHRDAPRLAAAGAVVVDEEGVTGDALARALAGRAPNAVSRPVQGDMESSREAMDSRQMIDASVRHRWCGIRASKGGVT
jgi:hypothetical protein